MRAAQQELMNIGGFDLGKRRRYRVYADPSWSESDDSVTVVTPDPANGKDVMVAKGLDSPHPAYHFPDGWSESDQEKAASEILRLWRADWRAPQIIGEAWDAANVRFVGDRRLQLVRPRGHVAVRVELTHSDGRAPTWVGGFYRLDRGPGTDHGMLMRISCRCVDWLGRHEGDSVGAGARRRLRATAWDLWMYAPEPGTARLNPMRDYTIVFIEPVDLDVLAAAACEAFDISRERLEIWDGDFAAPVSEPVIAQIAAGSGPGVYAEFVGFDAFAAHAGEPDLLEVAVALATRMQRRVLFGPEKAEEYRWTLVAGDGSHGKIVLDDDRLDEGTVSILGTVEPIAGAPDLPRLGLEFRGIVAVSLLGVLLDLVSLGGLW